MVVVRFLCDRKIDSRTLLHCNWGWGGWCDGYYYSKLFDVRQGAVELDDGDQSYLEYPNFKYTWWFRMITYDKPTAHPVKEFYYNLYYE